MEQRLYSLKYFRISVSLLGEFIFVKMRRLLLNKHSRCLSGEDKKKKRKKKAPNTECDVSRCKSNFRATPFQTRK